MMLRIVILLFAMVIGFGWGIWYDRKLMAGECAAGEGEWTGTICVNSELLQ